eukprot:91376-Pelagomonas_calceolata.AAC.3
MQHPPLCPLLPQALPQRPLLPAPRPPRLCQQPDRGRAGRGTSWNPTPAAAEWAAAAAAAAAAKFAPSAAAVQLLDCAAAAARPAWGPPHCDRICAKVGRCPSSAAMLFVFHQCPREAAKEYTAFLGWPLLFEPSLL